MCTVIPFFSQRGISGLRGRPLRTVNQLSLRIASGNAEQDRMLCQGFMCLANTYRTLCQCLPADKFGDKGESAV